MDPSNNAGAIGILFWSLYFHNGQNRTILPPPPSCLPSKIRQERGRASLSPPVLHPPHSHKPAELKELRGLHSQHSPPSLFVSTLSKQEQVKGSECKEKEQHSRIHPLPYTLIQLLLSTGRQGRKGGDSSGAPTCSHMHKQKGELLVEGGVQIGGGSRLAVFQRGDSLRGFLYFLRSITHVVLMIDQKA